MSGASTTPHGQAARSLKQAKLALRNLPRPDAREHQARDIQDKIQYSYPQIQWRDGEETEGMTEAGQLMSG